MLCAFCGRCSTSSVTGGPRCVRAKKQNTNTHKTRSHFATQAADIAPFFSTAAAAAAATRAQALSGFRNIHVIDMDTIDVSNLNRQFLFRSADVGKPKAEVAAAFINKRIKSANVTPHFAKIEEIETKGGMQRPDGTWYRQNDPIESFYDRFAIVIAGLDSIVARRWINSTCPWRRASTAHPLLPTPRPIYGSRAGASSTQHEKVCAAGPGTVRRAHPLPRPPAAQPAHRPRPGAPHSDPSRHAPETPGRAGKLFSMVQYNEAGEIEEGTSIPMVDGGTEGFKGQARVILPGKSSCIECTLSLYPPQKTFPMCTLATRPRVPEHCIEYIKVKIWGMPVEEGGMGETKLDGDNPAHIKWITEQSQARANEYGITGVTYRLTQGVVKNIIPAVASTNAVIAAACAHEALKITTGIADKLDDYMMWNDGEGIYNMVFQNFKPEACSGCTRNASVFESSAAMTLFEIVESLKEDNRFQMKKPGLIAEVGGNNLVLTSRTCSTPTPTSRRRWPSSAWATARSSTSRTPRRPSPWSSSSSSSDQWKNKQTPPPHTGTPAPPSRATPSTQEPPTTTHPALPRVFSCYVLCFFIETTHMANKGACGRDSIQDDPQNRVAG